MSKHQRDEGGGVDSTSQDIGGLEVLDLDIDKNVIADKYEILEPLGRGGMGIVYRARQYGTDREVAVKTLLPTSRMNEENVKRFEREVRVISSLNHPNTVKIFDAGSLEDGTLFFVMELLKGRSLAEEIREIGPMSFGRAVHIIMQVLKSLSEAHASGIVHRDLKPENIWLLELHGEKDFVKVLDFGVAKTRPSYTDVDPERVTQDGTIFGTPAYMGPEQLSDGEVGPWTDIYALGHLLYRMVKGETVYGSSSMVDIFVEKLSNPEPSFDPDILAGPIGAVIVKATAHDVSARYQSAEEMLESLRVLVGGEHTGEFMASDLFTRSAKMPALQMSTQPIQAAEARLAESELDVIVEEARKRRFKRNLLLIVFLLFIVGLGLAYWFIDSPEQLSPEEEVAEVEVEVVTEPSGAKLMVGEEVLGVTPFSIKREHGTEGLVAHLELDGFERHEVRLSFDANSKQSVALRPLSGSSEEERVGADGGSSSAEELKVEEGDSESAEAERTSDAVEEKASSSNSQRSKEKQSRKARDNAKAKDEARAEAVKEKKEVKEAGRGEEPLLEKEAKSSEGSGFGVEAQENEERAKKEKEKSGPAIPIFEEKKEIPTLD